MWTQTHTTTAKNITPEQVWRVWSDISIRADWDLDIEWARIDGVFENGAVIKFKPKGGPKTSMTVIDCVPNQTFTDVCKFPFARMYGIHAMHQTPQGLEISTTMKVTGLLGWLVRKLLAEKIAAEVPEQTDMLVKVAAELS